MALFPPEFIAAVLFAFVQVRLRSVVSVASLLTNGLTFFLPPEDELVHKLNGGPPPPPATKGSKAAPKPQPTPLSSEEKMRAFFINVAKTETGVFQQTLFYELYEMMVILATSTLVACASSDVLNYYFAWTVAPESADSVATGKAEISVYGLVSVLMVCLWFPLQVQLAQGIASYESRLGLSVGALGFILSLYSIFAPKPLVDFDLERAIALTGTRLEIVFRAIGFVDGDLENLAPAAATLRISSFAAVAFLCGLFTATSFLPAFRFARIYAEMVRDKSTSLPKKLLLHLNVILPLLCGICWIRPLATDLVVPSYLIRCSPRVLTRDCFASPQDQERFAATAVALTESQWHSARLAIVWLAIVVRVACFHDHLQFFLVEPKDAIVQLVRRPGRVDGELLKSKIRLQFNYAPIIAIQYLAPVGALLAVSVLLARQTVTSLGVFDAVAFVLMKTGVITPGRTLQWFTARPVLPSDAAPDVGGFRIGDDVNSESLKKFVQGMSDFSVVTPEAHASLLGFLIWWFTFAWFMMTVAGLVYWKNVPHGISTTGLTDPLESMASREQIRRNRETPKLLKNQLKGLKMKRH